MFGSHSNLSAPHAAVPVCVPYSIDGSLSTDLAASPESGLEVSATAFLHDGSEPLAGHQVYASFTMAGGAPATPPEVLLTDDDGRVSIMLPVGSVGVVFSTESPSAVCDAQAEPDVVSAVVERPLSPAVMPVTGRGEAAAIGGLVVLAVGVGVLVGRGRRRGVERSAR
ncbi:MAG: hypothetical protein B7C54_11910 [Acidimicrobiales bacterium mtb01]|nr:hypothetical protein [Actinomycetota bacterium]TEX45751.1 MAG: hypothetical protein B7C54_11910 [Acidimicrobiales bacterium mtb01]